MLRGGFIDPVCRSIDIAITYLHRDRVRSINAKTHYANAVYGQD